VTHPIAVRQSKNASHVNRLQQEDMRGFQTVQLTSSCVERWGDCTNDANSCCSPGVCVYENDQYSQCLSPLTDAPTSSPTSSQAPSDRPTEQHTAQPTEYPSFFVPRVIISSDEFSQGDAIDVVIESKKLLWNSWLGVYPEDTDSSVALSKGTSPWVYACGSKTCAVDSANTVLLDQVEIVLDDIEPGRYYKVFLVRSDNDNSIVTSSDSFYVEALPSAPPSTAPSGSPSVNPSMTLSKEPSAWPSVRRSELPSEFPSVIPSEQPSDVPSWEPTYLPSFVPSGRPSLEPSESPTLVPSGYSSDIPSNNPSAYPSEVPTNLPTESRPTPEPTAWLRELSTGFYHDTGQAGNMFDVIALETIQIREMDVHLTSLPNINVEIYTKHGTLYDGATNAALWTQMGSCEVDGQGDGIPTPLPDSCITPITIIDGEEMGIYVTARHTEMRYSWGFQAGGILAENDHLQITEGVGVVYPFSYVFSPRRWSGTLRYVLRSEASTTFDGTVNHSGYMFDVVAHSDIEIREMDINLGGTSTAGSFAEIFVYTKDGSYVGYESNLNGWELHDEVSVVPQASIARTSLPLDAYDDIFIGEGEVRAFYIGVSSGPSLLSSIDNDLTVGDICFGNDHVDILVGIAVDKSVVGAGFVVTTFTQNRIWNGALRYTLAGQGYTTPSPTADLGIAPTPPPSIKGLMEIETMSSLAPADKTIGHGIMFDIHTFDFEITIREIDIFVSNYPEGTMGYVEVFSKQGSHVGHELSSQSWNPIGDGDVISGGPNSRTPLPGDLLDPQTLEPDSITSLYITLSPHYSEILSLTYALGDEVDSVLVQNDELEILEGTGIFYPFQDSYSNRKFIGAIRYSRDTTSEPSAPP